MQHACAPGILTAQLHTHIHTHVDRVTKPTLPSSAFPMKYAACICTRTSMTKTQSANTSIATFQPHCVCHVCMYIYIYIYIYTCTYTHMCTLSFAHKQTHARARAHAHPRLHKTHADTESWVATVAADVAPFGLQQLRQMLHLLPKITFWRAPGVGCHDMSSCRETQVRKHVYKDLQT
jgi:hypothetical protein